MRHMIVIAGSSLMIAVLAACNGTVIRGDGNVVEQTRLVSEFSRIDHASFGDVNIRVGESYSVLLSADSNLQEYLTVEVEGDRLVLAQVNNTRLETDSSVVYTITVPSLRTVDSSSIGSISIIGLAADEFDLMISGAADATLNDVRFDSLNVDISGVGDVNIDGTVNRQNVEISGAGDYEAASLASERAEVRISGAGSATVRVDDRLLARNKRCRRHRLYR